MPGILENLDPRSKIISFLAMICCIILTPIVRFKDFELYFLVILTIMFLSQITPGQMLKRTSILIPWILIMAAFVPFVKEGFVCWSMNIGYWKFEITDKGVWTFLNIIIKSSLSALLLIIASLTTTFSDFMKGLELLHFPRLSIKILYFMCRSLFVFLSKTARMFQAKYLRFTDFPYGQPSQVSGYMARKLMGRTHERPEKRNKPKNPLELHAKIREAKEFSISSLDFIFITGIIVSLLCIVSGLVYKIEYIKRRDVHVWHGLSLF